LAACLKLFTLRRTSSVLTYSRSSQLALSREPMPKKKWINFLDALLETRHNLDESVEKKKAIVNL
jgi:hypothetical protein